MLRIIQCTNGDIKKECTLFLFILWHIIQTFYWPCLYLDETAAGAVFSTSPIQHYEIVFLLGNCFIV